MSRVQPSAIRELLRLGADPEIISFGGGYPDPALFPVSDLQDVYSRLLVPERALALQYTASGSIRRARRRPGYGAAPSLDETSRGRPSRSTRRSRFARAAGFRAPLPAETAQVRAALGGNHE